MSKNFTHYLAMMLLLQLAATGLFAQCINSSAYGSVIAPSGNTSPVQIQSCNYNGEYSTISSIISGNTYEFTGTGVGYVTVTTTSNAVLASGAAPLSWTASLDGSIRVHWNSDSSCGTDSDCHVTSISCTSCVPPPAGPGDDCSTAQDLAGLANPYSGTTAGYNATFTNTCSFGNSSPDRVFYIDVPTDYTLTIGQTSNAYDSENVVAYGGACPGNTIIDCFDDPDDKTVVWENTTGSTQRVYWIQDGFSSTGNAGAFTLAWSLTEPAGPCEDNIVRVNKTDSYGDGWNGATYTIRNDLDNVVASGTLSTGSSGVDEFCLPDGCYTYSLTAGTFPSEISWSVTINGGTPVISGGAPVSDVRLSINTVCPIYGCTDPSALNYNPEANTDDGSCVYPPDNDECVDAIPLTVGESCVYTPSTNANATASTGIPEPGCAGYSGGDVWFSVVVPSTGVLIIDSQTGVMTDGGMAIYSGTCGNLTLIECDDDDSDNGLMPSITRTGLTPGSTIYIRFWEFSNDNQGTFSICVSTPDPCSPIVDVTPPTVACYPQTITFNGETSIALDANDLVSSQDNCGVASTTLSPANIFCGQLGQTVPVQVTVRDINDRVSTCTSMITVLGLPCDQLEDGGGINCESSSVGYDIGAFNWVLENEGCYPYSPYTADQQAFAQQTICGDGEIIAHVTSISGGLGQAGVTMRESNAAGAKKVELTTSLGNFTTRAIRTVTNGPAFPQQIMGFNRFWLRLTRSGNQFIGYTSTDGISWSVALFANVSMNSCIEVGLILSNLQANSTVVATFDGITIIGDDDNVRPGFEDHSDPIITNNTGADFSVFPNPTTGQITVRIADYQDQSLTLDVIDTFGKRILAQQTERGSAGTTLDLDLTHLPAGIYFVRLHAEDGSEQIQRVVLQPRP